MIDIDAIRRAWTSNIIGTHWDTCHMTNRHERCAIANLCDEVEILRTQLHRARVESQTARELERRRCGDLARHYGVSGFLIHAIESEAPHPFSCMVKVDKPAAVSVCTGVEGVEV